MLQTFGPVAVAVVAFASCGSPAARADELTGPVRVTVVTILASTVNNVINPKLAELAKEVQKRDPGLVGFQIATTNSRAVSPGATETFSLVEKQELKVTVDRPGVGAGKVRMAITPPGLGEVRYTCVTEKFFPVVTPYRTSGGEQLIVAVMAKPTEK